MFPGGACPRTSLEVRTCGARGRGHAAPKSSLFLVDRVGISAGVYNTQTKGRSAIRIFKPTALVSDESSIDRIKISTYS